jgi:hypothetical protein
MSYLYLSLWTITIISFTHLYGMEGELTQIQTLENNMIKVKVTEKRASVGTDILYFKDLSISIRPTPEADVQICSPTINHHFDNKTHYVFDIPKINGPDIYVHGCSKDHAKLIKCNMGGMIQVASYNSVCTLDIKNDATSFFDSLWQQKEKDYSMALFRCFPGIYDKIYNYLPPHFVTIFHSASELFNPKAARNTKAVWYIPKQFDPIKPQLKILLDALQAQGPDATYTIGTPEFLSKSLKRYNNSESLIALTAASHLLGDYKQDECAIPVNLTDYFGNAALNATEQSYGWISGGHEVTMTPVGKVRIHQRGLRGRVQTLFGYQTVKTVIDTHPTMHTQAMLGIKALKSPQNQNQIDWRTALIHAKIQSLYRSSRVLIDTKKISRIIKELGLATPFEPEMQIQDIDVYDYNREKVLPRITLKTSTPRVHPQWNIRAIGTVSTTAIDTLEQRSGHRYFEQALCKYIRKNGDEWKRSSHSVQSLDEQFLGCILPRSSVAKEEIRYTPARAGTQNPYVRMYEPGFWRKLIYERRRTLLAEDQPLAQTGHYRILNLLNPLAWVCAFYATWME